MGDRRTLNIQACLVVIGICAFSGSPLIAQEESNDHEARTSNHAEKEFTVKLNAPDVAQCRASISFDYLQRNTMASVDWVVDHQDCAASSGSYTMRIRYRDENNEVHDLEVEESWQRADNSPVVGHGEYLIGDNVDLVNVRSRRMRCQCTASSPKTKDQ